MRPKVIERSSLSVLLALSAWYCQGQSRATCLYSESFSAPGVPADWVGLPATVERLDEEGLGTGEFVAPWQVGSAVQANAAGYFPVPDEPAGNTFAMANDDAPPCDCAMTGVSLFSPFFDLSGAPAPAVSYRVYHDGRPFNTHASLWASPDGGAWTLMEMIPAVLGAWQQRTVDLSAFASGQVQLSFRYDDGGQWASGIAVDDVCVFDRPQHDIALTNAWLGDATASAFNTSARSLGYSRLPIEQQTPLRLSARIRNNGTATASTVRVEATISVDGVPTVITDTVAASLDPLQDTLVSWDTGFLAGEAGQVEVALTAAAFDLDEETSDNSAQLQYEMTSAEQGNHTMALDNDLASAVCGSDGGFSAGCRYELIGGSSAVRGISVRFGEGTLPGSRVQAMLLDPVLNLLSASSNHTVSDEDLALSFSGGSVYIPLDSGFNVTADIDVLALVRCLPDSGVVRIACGGAAVLGSTFLTDGVPFTVSYPGTAPIVRMHFSEPVTAVPSVLPGAATLMILQGAAHGMFLIRGFPGSTDGVIDVLDVSGRMIARTVWQEGQSEVNLFAQGWAPGLYRVVARANEHAGRTRPLTGALVVE